MEDFGINNATNQHPLTCAVNLVNTQHHMFFHILLQRNIRLHPKHFGPQLRKILIQKLNSEVEGQCSGRYGYIICVTKIESVGKGKITDSGYALFPVTYKAIVFKPFKGEVVDGVVSRVSKLGFFAYIGPMEVFVSKQLISSDMKLDSSDASLPAYVSEDGTMRIQKDDEVRLKLLGVKMETNGLFAVGTIRENYLGPI